MFQFPGFALITLCIQVISTCLCSLLIAEANNNKQSGGLPHSEIHGSKHILGSPWLIAEYHVFHRLLLPRHSPNALFALDLIQKKSDLRQWCQAGSSRHLFLWSKVILFPPKHTYMFEHWTILRSFGLVYLTWTTCSFQSAYLRKAEERAKSKNFPQTEVCFTRLRPTRYFGGQTML